MALSPSTPLHADDVPSPPREFRAAWIATVANIDWPSKKGLSSAEQKAELVGLLDEAAALNLNALVFQIRPSADALYASKLEPWSEYLSGTMGQAPEPFYDPLKFAVEEAHRRGLHLHVWFNPYRVRQQDAKSEPSPDHASRTMPEAVRQYGPYLWFDPGEPASVRRFIDVITDVVKRYDIDGVHIDDYFYPYPVSENGMPVPFPDDESYARAREAGETLDRDDWRRKNVDQLVEQMYKSVKQEKPWVLVGISPFGIWRPGHPPGITGLDQYSALYADARKWLREGWVDYFTPQLYWQIEGPQSYPKLLAWWKEQNVQHRHLWPGNGAHNVRRNASVEPARNAWPAEELIRQIELTREIVPEPGNVFFSMKCLVDNRDGLKDKLKQGVYAEPAVIPASGWLGGKAPGKPEIAAKPNNKGVAVQLKAGKGERPWQWIVRVRTGEKWTINIAPGVETSRAVELDRGAKAEEVAVSAVSRLGIEGPAARVDVK
ncbi:MAG: family 10 glycosylhydrolase [Pirellulales bacterium]|nr:family 10 glycosylhydrolase [Pirellulales bacterium]